MEPKTKASPFASLLTTRKGVLTLIVLVMASGLELAIIAQAIRGTLSIDDAITKSFGVLLVATTAALTNVWAIAKEDAAEKSARGKDGAS